MAELPEGRPAVGPSDPSVSSTSRTARWISLEHAGAAPLEGAHQQAAFLVAVVQAGVLAAVAQLALDHLCAIGWVPL